MVAFCIFIGAAVVVTIVGVSMIATEGAEAAADFNASLQIFSFLGYLVVLGVMVPGLDGWRRLPALTRARGLAATSLWLTVAYMALSVLAFALSAPDLGDPAAAQHVSTFRFALGVVSTLALAVAVASFLLSLARAATHVGRPEIAALARRTFVVSLIVLGLGLTLVLVASGLAGTGPDGVRAAIGLIGVLGLVAGGLGVWALVDVMRVIAKLRAAILREVSIVGEF
ncbi:MAG: hypothetical protein CVU56_04640 [Deltaproteobacteria bacterium HGW-Deltaproteobacteria-14]|jgi:hypothetical protein|nr:MAG: hypothetical protein CVU56_04640 [Deltaproteobacteria bacterium HGW-Deltaproteobacteria-14]